MGGPVRLGYEGDIPLRRWPSSGKLNSEKDLTRESLRKVFRQGEQPEVKIVDLVRM